MCGWMLFLFLALTLVPSTSTATACNSSQVYYVHPVIHVLPILGTACLQRPCVTLNDIIANPDRYITSNTVFKLLPGRHKLTGQFVASNVECITIKPYTFIGVVQVLSIVEVRTLVSSSTILFTCLWLELTLIYPSLAPEMLI